MPAVTSVEPKTGSTEGGRLVAISGTNFTGATAVKFGSTAAPSIYVASETSIDAVSPPGLGTVDVTVTTPEGTSATSEADHYGYFEPPECQRAGNPVIHSVEPTSAPAGTQVRITGERFFVVICGDIGDHVQHVLFGAREASFTQKSSSEIIATAPPGTGTVPIVLESLIGQSSVTFPPRYTYVGPGVTKLEPNHGLPSGGTAVTINGNYFKEVTAVKFGSINATSFEALSEGKIKAVAPPGTGTVDVTVTTAAGGTSATTSSDRFSYLLPPPAGSTVAWGANESGQLGNGNTFSADVPVAVSELTGLSAVAAGAFHSVALKRNGSVVAWGDNSFGELGNGTCCEKSDVPVTVSGLSEVTAIAGGGYHTLALLRNGTVMAWGENVEGELGNGNETNSDVPIPVSGLTEVAAIAAGRTDSLALLRNGTVMAWGSGESGQLGTGSTAKSMLPVPVCAAGETAPCAGHLSEVTAVAAHGSVSSALRKNGTVMDWGDGGLGALGDGGTAQSDAPVAVSGLTEVAALPNGGASMALLRNGTVVDWGQGSFLGDGGGNGPELCEGIPCSRVPVTATGLTHVIAIAGGLEHRLALLSDGEVMAWGAGGQGQLGNGTEGFAALPVPVSELSGATAIAGGQYHSIAATVACPIVAQVTPPGGPVTGGTSVRIIGKNFTGVTGVSFGSTKATSFAPVSASEIAAVAPAGAGTADVDVEAPECQHFVGVPDHFTYTPTYSLNAGSEALTGVPSDAAVNSEGDVWVSSWEAGTVRELKENGEPLRTLRALESPCSGSLDGPFGLAVDSSGNLWVTDLLDGRIRKFSPEGTCLMQLGSEGSGPGQFKHARAIAVDSHGNLWIADTGNDRVQELSGEGAFERQVGPSLGGGGQLSGPGGLAADSAGRIWVSDIGHARVVELGQQGEYLGQIGETNTIGCDPLMCLPMAVAIDSAGNIMVADYGHSRVDQFSEDGQLLNEVGGFGSGEGQFEWPLGVATDSKGNVWVPDWGNGRLDRWTGG